MSSAEKEVRRFGRRIDQNRPSKRVGEALGLSGTSAAKRQEKAQQRTLEEQQLRARQSALLRSGELAGEEALRKAGLRKGGKRSILVATSETGARDLLQ